MKKFIFLIFASLFLINNVYALNLSRVKTWGVEILTDTDLNAEFDNILNHSIVNADVSASAAIVGSKLDLSVPGAIGGTTPAAGTFTTLAATGNTTLGNGADSVTFNSSSGITYTPAATWTFSASQTVSGTWANLGTVTTADINGGTADGVTIGGSSAGAGTFTTLSSTGATTIGDAAADTLQINANTIQFEGATANDHETIFSMPDPTAADVTVTFPLMSGAPMLSTLTTNAAGVADSVTGGTNQLIFEGATGNTIQTFLTVTDPTDSDKTITLPNATGTVWISGTENTNTTQPAFLATPAVQQANLATGSDITIVFGTEIFDQGADFAANTFTAPVTGRYILNFNLFCSDLDSAATYYQPSIITSNRSYLSRFTATQFAGDVASWSLLFSVVADMDANDTAYVALNQPNGTAQTDIETYSTFSGGLLF